MLYLPKCFAQQLNMHKSLNPACMDQSVTKCAVCHYDAKTTHALKAHLEDVKTDKTHIETVALKTALLEKRVDEVKDRVCYCLSCCAHL